MATPTPQWSKISKAKARIMLAHPFFATLLLRTEQVIIDKDAAGKGVDMAATDGQRMYWNPDFLEQLSVDDTMVVACHEIGHDALLHSLRMELRDPEDWNRACDHAINLMLEDQGMKCPKAVPGGWLADPKYKGWSADRIYDDLRRNPPPPPPSGGGGDDDDDQPGKPGQGSPGAPKPGQGKPAPGSGAPKDWLHGDLRPTTAKTQEELTEQVQNAKQRVASAANMARMAGKLTGDLERMVNEFLEAKVHWTDVLREHMTKVVKARESWARRNKRFQKIYLPQRHEKKMGPMIFVPDTSMSMWGDDMEKICSEMAHCSEQTRPDHIRVIWADTEVKGEQVFEASEFSFGALKPVGGGGTDMRKPLEYAERYDPQVVVLMTDGETPWPSVEPPFPLIVVCTTDAECPWGVVIRI